MHTWVLFALEVVDIPESPAKAPTGSDGMTAEQQLCSNTTMISCVLKLAQHVPTISYSFFEFLHVAQA